MQTLLPDSRRYSGNAGRRSYHARTVWQALITVAQIHATLAQKRMTGEAFTLLAGYELFPELYFSSHDIDNISESFLENLEGTLIKHKFLSSLHAPFMSQDIGTVDVDLQQRSVKRLQKTLDIAARLSSKPVVIHPGYGDIAGDSEFEQWLQRATPCIKTLCRDADRLGLQIAFENIYDATPDRLEIILDTADSKAAGICFDTGHYNLFSPLPMLSWLNKFGERILVCHVHDNDKSGDQHLAIGDGCLDYSPLISWYNQLPTGQKPVMTLEALNPIDLIKSVERINRWDI